jgi:hypothetical protein
MDCFVALLLAMTTLHCRCDKATRRANQQNLSIPSHKNISLNPSGKSKVKSRPSRPARGAYRDRHGRRVRDAVAAAMPGAQDVCRADVSVSEHSAPDESIAADGKTVWSWRPLLASSRRRSCEALPGFAWAFNPAATEARGIRLRGERDISLKTTAQGMPECSDCTCMLVCAFLRTYCTRDRGCSKHPAFPAPSCFSGR